MDLSLSASLSLSDRKSAIVEHVEQHLAVPSVRDAGAPHLLPYLAVALRFQRPDLFTHCALWARQVFLHRDRADADLLALLHALSAGIVAALPAGESGLAQGYVTLAIQQLGQAAAPEPAPAATEPGMAAPLLGALLARDLPTTQSLVQAGLESLGSRAALSAGLLQPVLHEVGLLWERNRISAADEHYCTSCLRVVLARLPRPAQPDPGWRGTAVCGCVGGEYHDLGVSVVADSLEDDGWKPVYIGASTPGQDLLRTVIETRASLLAVSCGYPPNLTEVQMLVDAARALPEVAGLKIMVGGYAFNHCPGLWQQVGADGFAADAQEAVRVARELA